MLTCSCPRQKRFIYSWVRDSISLPISSVCVPETNTISMDPCDVERVLWEKWQPVFCPSPEQEALPDFHAFWNRFGRFVVCAPVDLPLLSGEDLRSAVFNMCDHSAGGADGWQVHEIKVWPMFLFQKLADMLNDVESSGVWPDDLLIQIISLIPKDADGLDQRPITVATLVYRAWASARAKALCTWQETWAHPSQFGYRRGKRSVDPAWYSSAAAEHAWISQFHRVGFSLDLAKAFDRVPHQILYNCLVASGLPVTFTNTWLSAIRGAKKYLKSAYGLGRSFHVTRGVPQGDALACFGMNLLMGIFSRAVESETSASVRSFADDATVEVQHQCVSVAVQQLQAAISVTEQFTTLSGQQPNVGKCHVWSTSKKGRKALRGISMLGQPLLQKRSAKDLGCQTLYCGPPCSGVIQTRFAKARKTAQRARCAPLCLEHKVQLVTGAASSLANYGLETSFVGDGVLSRLRSAVVMAIWDFRRRFRSSHAVLLLFTQAHLTDPFHAQVCQCFLTLQRCLSRGLVDVATWQSWWETALQHRARRPRGPITLLWHLLDRIEWSWPSACFLRTHDGVALEISRVKPDALAHHLREATRLQGWKQAFALHKHFDGVQHFGVDRVATLHLSEHTVLSPHCLRLLRCILTDAVWTNSRLFHGGRLSTPSCTLCGHDHQDTNHFFWSCPELRELQSKHNCLFSLRSTCGPWPSCLELCGLVPTNLVVPGFSRTQVAALVQSYLLDVVRRSWELGWPKDEHSDSLVPDAPHKPIVPFVLKLPESPPKLSATTFPWPDAFCNDLLVFLNTLVWPKDPTNHGVSWAELAVNFEIVIGKALPRNPEKRRARHLRTYGEPAVPLLESSDNLYQKVVTMNNALRCLARLLGVPVVVGRQTRNVIIPDLPGKHRYKGLDRRPIMTKADETQEAIRTCLHDRVAAEIDASSAAITAGATQACNPVEHAYTKLHPLKWKVPQSVAQKTAHVEQKHPQPQDNAKTCVGSCDARTSPSSPPISNPNMLHDVVKVGNRWTCRNCPCSTSASNGGRFKAAKCLGDRCHAFVFRDGLFVCKKCGETVSNEKQMHGKLPHACPGDVRTVDAAPKAAASKVRTVPDDHRRHDLVRGINQWCCKNCPATCSLSNSGRFKNAQCFGENAHDFVSNGKEFKCSKCGAAAASDKQMRGKLAFSCPGPTTQEASFRHEIPEKPDSAGKYTCRKCKRTSVKKSVSRFMKSLCFGSHATSRSDAIRASRCVHGLSVTGLPAAELPKLQAFKRSDVNMEPD